MEIPRLNIGEYSFLPIVMGAMGVRITGPGLVAAVANQDCLPTLTTIGLMDLYKGVKAIDFIRISNESLEKNIAILKGLTDQPFAINVMCAL